MPGGTRISIKIDMSTTEFDQENVIPVTEANLKDEQSKLLQKPWRITSNNV